MFASNFMEFNPFLLSKFPTLSNFFFVLKKKRNKLEGSMKMIKLINYKLMEINGFNIYFLKLDGQIC